MLFYHVVIFQILVIAQVVVWLIMMLLLFCMYVATCARQVKVTWLCRGPEQLALVHEAFQSLVR